MSTFAIPMNRIELQNQLERIEEKVRTLDLGRKFVWRGRHIPCVAETASAAITGSDDARGVLSLVRHPSCGEGLL